MPTEEQFPIYLLKTDEYIKRIKSVMRKENKIYVTVTVYAGSSSAERMVLERAGAVFLRRFVRNDIRMMEYRVLGDRLISSLEKWRDGREWLHYAKPMGNLARRY